MPPSVDYKKKVVATAAKKCKENLKFAISYNIW